MILYAYFLENKLFCVSDATERCKGHDAKYWQEKANKEYLERCGSMPEDGLAKILYIEVPKEMEMVTKALLQAYTSQRERSLSTIQIYLDRINSEVSNLNAEFTNLVSFYKPIDNE